MQCDRCKDAIPEDEAREFHGQTLCEDCYMDALSPPRTCDPWAVHSAKSFGKEGGAQPQVTPRQSEILRILKETGGLEPNDLAGRLRIKTSDLEKEIASLRHMERVRGELREGRKYVILW